MAGGCDSVVTLNLTIKPNYTITASAGSNGSISNSGASTICEGSNQSYSITPNAGYYIADVLVNGVSQGAITNYTFSNVSTNHTIAASFALSCTPSTSNTSHTACDTYTWNGTTYTTSGDYVKHFTNSCGLDSAATLHLIINNATSSSQTASVCSNQIPFVWNGLTFNAAGTQTKTGFTNSKGCDSSATLVLSVATVSSPTISVSATSSNVCAGTLVTYTATPTNGGTAPQYQWKKNGVNVGIGTATYQTTSLANNDSIWCVLTSNSACATTPTATSNKIKMIVYPNPAIGTSIGGTICTIGGILSVNNTNTLYGGVWTSDNTGIVSVTTASNQASGNAVAVSNGTAILTYTKTNINGCSVSASCIVTVAAVTPPIITGASAVCVGSTAQLAVNTSGGSWLSLNNRATVSPTGLLTAANAGVGNIKYNVTNAYGCSGFATYTPTVTAKPTQPSISFAVGNTVNPQSGAVPTTAYCNNRTFTLAGNPTGGGWSSSNTAVITVTNAGVVSTVGVGTGSVIYTVTTNGCSNSRSIVGNIVGCAARGMNGIENGKLKMENEFTMYPNPAHSFIRLNVNSLMGSGSIVVTDLYGKQVKTQNLSMGTNTIDVSTLSKGMYFVSTITNEGKTTKKLVVE